MTIIPVRGELLIPHRRQRGVALRIIDQGFHHFISPTASGAGSGSFESPWSLTQFLANPGTVLPGERTAMRCVPGSELYEQSGSFTWSSTLNGELGNGPDDFTKKINLHAYTPDGGLPTISSTGTANETTIRIDGTHLVIKGIRVRKNNTIRNNARGTGLWLRGAFDNKPTGSGMLIYCYFEDAANGVFTGNSAGTDFQGGDWTVYGCVFINNGEDDGPRNHAVYSRHQGDGRWRLIGNIIGMGLANSLMVYDENASVDGITNVDIENNILFQAGILGTQTGNWWNLILGGGGAADSPARECNVTENILYHATNDSETANFQLGSIGATNEHVVVQDNLIYGGQQDDIVRIHTFRTDGSPTLVYRNNRHYHKSDRVALVQSGSLAAWSWQGNTYYTNGATGQNLFVHGGVNRTLAGLQANAGIGDSDTDTTEPTSYQIFIFLVDTYEEGRTHVFIKNWDATSPIPIPLDGILINGDSFRVYRAQDPHVAHIQSGTDTFTYTGTPFQYDMANAPNAIQAPIGTCPRSAPSLRGNTLTTASAECLIIRKVA